MGEPMTRHGLLIMLCILFAVVPLWARRTETGFLNRTVKSGGVVYRYQMYVPADWEKGKHWPVLLFLHGKGERGEDGLLQTDVGIGHAIRNRAAEYEMLVVMPQLRKEKLWTDADMEAQVLAALEQTIKEFHGDRDRVYLSGLSMGGYATWDLAAKYPERWAALAPICGGIYGPEDFPALHVSLVDDPKVADPYAETARRVGKTPVWVFHGGDDDTVPVAESRKMVAALRAVNANVRYSEYLGVGHNSWVRAYAEPEFVPWLLRQSLKR